MNNIAKIQMYLFLLFLTACKAGNASKNKSIVGLETEEIGKIKRSDAPAFYGLAYWFNQFEISIKTPEPDNKNKNKRSMTTADIKAKLPQEYRKMILEYLDDQLVRINAFKNKIQYNDVAGVDALLEKETQEMKDIALVILMPFNNKDTSYTPQSGDKLALTLYQIKTKSQSNTVLVDRFATKDYMEHILKSEKYSNVGDHVESIEKQRLNYLSFLKNKYKNYKEFSKFLDKTYKSTEALKKNLETNDSSLSLNGNETAISSQNETASGLIAVMASLLGTGASQQQSYPRMRPQPFDYSNGRGADNYNNDANGRNDRSYNGNAAGGGIKFDPPGTKWRQDAELAGGPNSRNYRNGPNDPYEQGSRDMMALSDASTNSSDKKNDEAIFKTFFDPRSMGGLQLAGSSPIGTVRKPDYPCSEKLSGDQMVLCHRTAGFFMKLDESKRKKSAKSSSQSGFSLDAPRSFEILFDLVFRVKAGSAEDGVGHMMNQGDTPSCSLQAAVGAAYIGLALNGDPSPETSLPKDGNAINQQFASLQSSQASLDAAVIAMRQLVERAGYTLNVDEEIEGVDKALACIASGNPALLANSIEMSSWTASGGGKEFKGYTPQSREDQNAAGDGMLQCDGGQNGHAFVGIGFDRDKGYMLIKNSWGATWSDGGVGYMSLTTCGKGLYGYCVKITKGGGQGPANGP